MKKRSRETESETQLEDAALLSYLDSLLREATEPLVMRTLENVTAEEPSIIERLHPELPVISANSLDEVPLVKTSEEAPIDSNEDALEWKDGRPVWANSRFEVLLFEMHGVKFAAPLIELGLIHNLDKELTRMAGHPEWVAGVLPMQGKSILVADTLKALMPDKPHKTETADFKYVITINNTQWGLTCSKLIKAQTMEPHQVKWRNFTGSRNWLVGTVLDQMCCLVDVKVLAQGFDKKTKRH